MSSRSAPTISPSRGYPRSRRSPPAEYQASIITADDVKNGLVTAEVQTVSGSNVWLALPYVVHVGLASYSVSTTLTYAYGAGMVRIVVQR